MDKAHGKAWATSGFAIGIVASISANVAHSFVRPPHVAVWHPAPGAVVFAAFWPIALLVAIETIARVEWPHGKGWFAVRYGGLVAVASIAAILSYRHMSGLLVNYGEDSLNATIGPLAVDGLMLVSTAALLAIGRRTALSAPVSLPAAEPPQDTSVALAVPQEPVQQDHLAVVAVSLPTTSTELRKAQARQDYLDSVAKGEPLHYKELATRHERSERWARTVIAEAKAA